MTEAITMSEVLTWGLTGLVVLAILIVILARLYVRSTREVSLVKTGIGGRKVIMDGGTIAIPYFHEISRVNMQTLRLEVFRTGEAALITNDRLRVDVGLAFYISVTPTHDGIARAAQTLGDRTFHPEQLRDLIEGKLVDALRSVAARMTMDELHENRGTFVNEVRDGLKDSLARNGLELDSVSLTALDQTPFAALDENNVFNAVGMRKLAEVIAKSKKERAQIDADAEVSVRKAAVEATKLKLKIDLEEQEAEISKAREVEFLKAAQLAEVVRRKADSEREVELARIEMERAIREADIRKEQELQKAEIAREQDIEIAQQQRQITIAQKSREESKARAEADAARAAAVRDAEAIVTARQVAEAERRKEIALLEAVQEAEIQGTRLRMGAAAEHDAAVERGKAQVEAARAEADASGLRAGGLKQESIARAEGSRSAIEAENAMTEQTVAMRLEMARLETLPKVVEQMVKPAEKIDSIKIHQISGLGSGSGGDGKGAADKPAINKVVDSIMDMAVQLPGLRKIGEELGLSLEEELSALKGRSGAKPDKDEA